MIESVDEVLSAADNYVHELLLNESSGHDYEHTLRVVRMADILSREYECDRLVVLLAAYLHDVDDPKVFESNEKEHKHLFAFFQQLILRMFARIIYRVLLTI